MENVTLNIDGVAQDCTVIIDQNGDFVCTAPDGRFLKFPGDGDLTTMVEASNEANPLSE